MEMTKTFKIFLAAIAVIAGIAVVGAMPGHDHPAVDPVTTYKGR